VRKALILVALLLVAGTGRAQQPQPGRVVIRGSGQGLPSGDCPLYVVDGQVIGPAGDCAATRPTPRPDRTPPAAAEDPLARFLYPPELIMAHQEAIGLSDKQRTAIQDAVKEAQAKLVDMQFRMSGEVEKLQRLIQATTPDEPKVLDEVNRVLTLERDVKVTQMTLMVRIKSQLTERQQSQLNQMRGMPPVSIDPLTGRPRPPGE